MIRIPHLFSLGLVALWWSACQPRPVSDPGHTDPAFPDSIVLPDMKWISVPPVELSRDGSFAWTNKGPHGASLHDAGSGEIVFELSGQDGFRNLYFGTNGVLAAEDEAGNLLALVGGEMKSLGSSSGTLLDLVAEKAGNHYCELLLETERTVLKVDGSWEVSLPMAGEGSLDADANLNKVAVKLAGEGGARQMVYILDHKAQEARQIFLKEGEGEGAAFSGNQVAVLAEDGLWWGSNDFSQSDGNLRDQWESSADQWLIGRKESYLDNNSYHYHLRLVNPTTGAVLRQTRLTADVGSRYREDASGKLWRYWLDGNSELRKEEVPWD